MPFNIDELERADTINYVDDTDTADVRQSKNALITTKKITDKYKRLSRKRKRNKSPEPIEGPIKSHLLAPNQKNPQLFKLERYLKNIKKWQINKYGR